MRCTHLLSNLWSNYNIQWQKQQQLEWCETACKSACPAKLWCIFDSLKSVKSNMSCWYLNLVVIILSVLVLVAVYVTQITVQCAVHFVLSHSSRFFSSSSYQVLVFVANIFFNSFNISLIFICLVFDGIDSNKQQQLIRKKIFSKINHPKIISLMAAKFACFILHYILSDDFVVDDPICLFNRIEIREYDGEKIWWRW